MVSRLRLAFSPSTKPTHPKMQLLFDLAYPNVDLSTGSGLPQRVAERCAVDWTHTLNIQVSTRPKDRLNIRRLYYRCSGCQPSRPFIRYGPGVSSDMVDELIARAESWNEHHHREQKEEREATKAVAKAEKQAQKAVERAAKVAAQAKLNTAPKKKGRAKGTRVIQSSPVRGPKSSPPSPMIHPQSAPTSPLKRFPSPISVANSDSDLGDWTPPPLDNVLRFFKSGHELVANTNFEVSEGPVTGSSNAAGEAAMPKKRALEVESSLSSTSVKKPRVVQESESYQVLARDLDSDQIFVSHLLRQV
ncbi:hypothetical protein PQX77_002785 [Marasmius sp. AFHP31]|nr:hypothetical protein PQX77_002785 [Marasmius sp. AFHP31]